MDEWLEGGTNLEQWEHGKVKLSARDKRILITQWVGAAWETIFSDPCYHPDRYFERTGCLLTLDGSEDEKVNIQGLPFYKPPHADVSVLDPNELTFGNIVPALAEHEPEIPDVDSLLPDIEDDVEITEADAPLNDDEEYVVLNT